MKTQKSGELADEQMIDDNELMEAVRDGRVEKLAVLFERHHVRLFNFMLRLTGNPNLSEDLVQEVFCRILKYRSTYKGLSKFTVWMYQIARNTHIDYLRKKKDELPIEDIWEEAAGREKTPEDRMEINRDIAVMQKALTMLPLKKREILVMSRFQNLKYREIAEMLGCQIGTVKAHVHRAIKELRTIYQELTGEVIS